VEGGTVSTQPKAKWKLARGGVKWGISARESARESGCSSGHDEGSNMDQ